MQIRTWPGNMSSCLEQRKAHYYIRELYRQRVKHGRDSFSKQEFDRRIQPGKLEKSFFHLALNCAQRGVLVKHSLWPLLYLPLSAALSPWQARYFYDSIRLKLAWPESMRSS
jgi:hypothetical protein